MRILSYLLIVLLALEYREDVCGQQEVFLFLILPGLLAIADAIFG